MKDLLRKILKPLASRKVRTGLVTLAAAVAAEYGFQVNPEILLTILGIGVSIIFGIAIEDHGTKTAAKGNGQ